jgi:hypothetical protein
MATKRHTCFTVTCDICGAEHENDESGCILHYDDPEHAAEDARDHDWAATEDAMRAVCPADDDAHLAAYAEVLAASEAEDAARTITAQEQPR